MRLPSQIAVFRSLLAADIAFPQVLSPLRDELPCAGAWLDSYLGLSSTGRYAFYAPPKWDIQCVSAALPDVNWRTMMYLDTLSDVQDHGFQLVWLERAHIDRGILAQINGALDANAIARNLMTFARDTDEEPRITSSAQETLDVTPFKPDAPIPDVQVLQNMNDTALLRVPSQLVPYIDQALPPHWVPTVLFTTPSPFIPTLTSSVERVHKILSSVKYDDVIAEIVDDISVAQLRQDLRWLTGEDPTSPIISRHSLSDGSLVAAVWLKERYEETGADCVLKPFLPGFAPNVICTYAASEPTSETILVSSHYDSRGSFGSLRAPGGDDDGSGTTGLLSIARVIGKRGLRFKRNVQFVAFAGEEQGLRGSRAYAEQLNQEGADLVFMIQADMTGFHLPGEPLQLGLPATIGTAELAQLVGNVSALYVPELEVGTTGACCSDHQSFWEKGFPATQVFERNGPIVDPMYHNSGDLSDRPGFDFEQVAAIAKVEFATLLHGAGFHL